MTLEEVAALEPGTLLVWTPMSGRALVEFDRTTPILNMERPGDPAALCRLLGSTVPVTLMLDRLELPTANDLLTLDGGEA